MNRAKNTAARLTTSFHFCLPATGARHVAGTRLQKFPLAGEIKILARVDSGDAKAPKHSKPFEVVPWKRILDPIDLVTGSLEHTECLDRFLRRPRFVGIDHDWELAACG